MADEETEEAQPEQKKGGLPLFSIIAVVAVLILAAVYFFFFRSDPSEDEEIAEKRPKLEEPEIVYEDIESLILNPKGAGFKRFLTIKIELLVADRETLEKLEAEPIFKTQITDILVELLSDKTVDQLEAPSAKDDIKGELLPRLNNLLGPHFLKEKEMVSEAVKDIYYVKFLIQ